MTKSAIILGGTAGVGRAVCDLLVARGYRVGVVARGVARLRELEGIHPGKVTGADADVSDAEALDAACDRLVAEIGAPEVWVNAAMLTSFSPFTQVPPDEFQRIVDVTFMGQVNGTRTAMRLMQAGRIICVGSGLAYRPVPNQAAYCAAKHAINGFVGALRSELLSQDSPLSLHLVQLPAINTPQFDWAKNRMDRKPQPAPPIFAPEVAARAVLQAIDDGPRELLVGKSVIGLVFGDMVLPGLIDRRLADSGVEQQKSDQPDNRDDDNLFTPVEMPSRAEGSYGERASDEGRIMDADRLRKAVFFGVPALTFLLGLIIG